MEKSFQKSVLVLIGVLITSLTTQVWATMANFVEGSYIYFDVTNCSSWAASCDLKMNFYTSNGTYKSHQILRGSEAYTTNVYRFTIPSEGVGAFSIERLNPNNHGARYNYTAIIYANSRSDDSQNSVCVPNTVYDNAPLSWGTFHPYANVYDGDDSKVAQVMTHNLENASTATYAYPFKEWVEPHEYPFGAWRGQEITKTNGVYAFYIPAGFDYTVNGYKYGGSDETTNDLHATNNPTEDHHRSEGTYIWTGKGNAYYSKTGMKIEITSSAYELYVGETATFTITAVSPITGLDGLEIWEEGVKLAGTPSGSGTSRTFTFTATTAGVRNISPRIHFTFNGQDIYLCSDMKIEVYEKYKIKVQNTFDWDKIKLYMFRSGDNQIYNATFPGEEVTEFIANDGEHDWYYVTLDSKYDRFMLANSDASQKTYDGGMSFDKATYEGNCYDIQQNEGYTKCFTHQVNPCVEFYRLKSSCAGAKTYYSNTLMNAGKFSLYAQSAGTLTLQHIVGSTWTDMASTITRTGITKDSVYVADFNGSNTTNNFVFYNGDYHIHCNATTKNYLDGGASKPGTTGTKFIQFNKSRIFNDTYDHYWVDWFDGGQTVVGSVGNTYNPNLAGVLGADELAPAGVTIGDGGNVRFAYNPSNNSFTRSILAAGGSLVTISGLGGDSIMTINKSTDKYTENASTTPQPFHDATNWVYTVDAEVIGNAHATVQSSYNSVAYVLANKKKLMGGVAGSTYEVEISYDFKTNRLLAAWMPQSGDAISKGFSLESNLMLVRTEDETTTILNISGANRVTDISKIFTAFEFLESSWDTPAKHANRRISSGGYEDEFYWFSLPYKCYMGDVFGIEGYGPNGNWVVMTYHGDYRAEQGWWAETDNWWYYLDRTDTLQANQGYVLRVTNLNELFPEDDDPKLYLYFPSYDENLTIEPIGTGSPKTVQTTVPEHICTKVRDEANHAGDPNYDRRAIDSNWNIIGSPSFNTATLATTGWPADASTYPPDPIPTEPTLKYFFTWSVVAGEGTYTVKNATNFQFEALTAYLVQYAGKIDWKAGSEEGQPLVGFTKAPARNQEESGEQTLRLVLNRNGQEEDVAYISRMAEGATEGYDLNKDLSKLMNKGGNNIYTIAGYYKMAGNCLPETTETIPVGVQLATAGEYTVSIPEGTNGTGVTLVDNVANTSTNLALTDYTVHLEAGTTDGRFMLKLSPIANTPTGIDLINDENGASKRLVDGTLYIVKDGEVFDARGNRIK